MGRMSVRTKRNDKKLGKILLVSLMPSCGQFWKFLSDVPDLILEGFCFKKETFFFYQNFTKACFVK